MIIVSSRTKVTKLKQAHDKDEGIYYTFTYRPDVWEASTEYLLDSVVIPSVPTGYYYVCINPGISSLSEPAFAKRINGVTLDGVDAGLGVLKWKAYPYGMLVRTGDLITSSIWSGDGITVSNEGFTPTKSYCKITIADVTLLEFTLTNSVVVTRVDGRIENFDRSILVPINIL